jgi:hypothetical protein
MLALSQWRSVVGKISISINTHSVVVFDNFVRIFGGIGENIISIHEINPC